MRGSCTPTSRTSTPTRGGRRRRHGGRDGVAERARGGRARSSRCGGGSPARRPLNVPRSLLPARGLAALPGARPRRGAACLRVAAGALVPARGASWDQPLAEAARRRPLPGRPRVERGRAGDLRDRIPGAATSTTRCSRVSSPSTASRPRAAGSCSPTTRPCRRSPTTTRTLALAGAPGQWAFPAADTLVGAKYAARRFLRRVRRCRTR